MALPVPSISCCVLNHHNLFNQIQNTLAFKWDTCCHLALCLQLLPFHYRKNILRTFCKYPPDTKASNIQLMNLQSFVFICQIKFFSLFIFYWNAPSWANLIKHFWCNKLEYFLLPDTAILTLRGNTGNVFTMLHFLCNLRMNGSK